MTAVTDDIVEFENFNFPHRPEFWSRMWQVAKCPRCHAVHSVGADSSEDAAEGFATQPTPTHTKDECIRHLGETVSDLAGEIESIKNTLSNVRDSF